MTAGTTDDVRSLYERYPFPRRSADAAPDFMYASVWLPHFTRERLAGRRILEAGCGTGHKLVALAKTYREAQFVAIDLSAASLQIARSLCEREGVTNVELLQGDLLELDREAEFDLVSSSGVVHHLSDPERGLAALVRALKPDGQLLVWLYHPFGDAERLLQRELLHALWGANRSDLTLGEALMSELKLDLDPGHYGPGRRSYDVLEGNADAFMHPIVHAYRFDEALGLLRRAGCEVAAVDFVSIQHFVKYLNLSGVVLTSPTPMSTEMSALRAAFELSVDALLPTPMLRERFGQLPRREQLRVVELAVRPRGFQVVAGRAGALEALGDRIRGNAVSLSAE